MEHGQLVEGLIIFALIWTFLGTITFSFFSGLELKAIKETMGNDGHSAVYWAGVYTAVLLLFVVCWPWFSAYFIGQRLAK